MKWGTDASKLVFNNIDKCGLKVISDDLKNWCMEDMSRCIYAKGIENRLVENGVEIIGTILDLFKLMTEDDTCQTHQEQIGAVTRFWKDLGELWSYLSGFEYKFDKVNMPKHIKKSTIKSAIHAYKKREHLKMEQIIKQDFPQMYKIIHDIQVELENVMELLNNLFDWIDKSTDVVMNEVDGAINGVVGEISDTFDSIGAGVSTMFGGGAKDDWITHPPMPTKIDFNALGQQDTLAKLKPDFGLPDLDQVFGAPHFEAPRFPHFDQFRFF
jgi:hypothetical protein